MRKREGESGETHQAVAEREDVFRRRKRHVAGFPLAIVLLCVHCEQPLLHLLDDLCVRHCPPVAVRSRPAANNRTGSPRSESDSLPRASTRCREAFRLSPAGAAVSCSRRRFPPPSAGTSPNRRCGGTRPPLERARAGSLRSCSTFRVACACTSSDEPVRQSASSPSSRTSVAIRVVDC